MNCCKRNHNSASDTTTTTNSTKSWARSVVSRDDFNGLDDSEDKNITEVVEQMKKALHPNHGVLNRGSNIHLSVRSYVVQDDMVVFYLDNVVSCDNSFQSTLMELFGKRIRWEMQPSESSRNAKPIISIYVPLTRQMTYSFRQKITMLVSVVGITLCVFVQNRNIFPWGSFPG